MSGVRKLKARLKALATPDGFIMARDTYHFVGASPSHRRVVSEDPESGHIHINIELGDRPGPEPTRSLPAIPAAAVAGPSTATMPLRIPPKSRTRQLKSSEIDPLRVNPTGFNRVETQIDDTVGVMRENINKVSQRGERLDALQDKTDNLAVSAQGFRRGANRVRKQMWWKDMKMRMCLIAGIVILILIIVIPAVVATRK